MKSVIKSISAIILVLVLITGCGGNETGQIKTERFVKATEILPGSSAEISVYNGVVKERRGVTLSFKVGGTIEQLLVKEGQYVKEGQILATLDKRDYQVNIQAAEAQYSQAKGEYERYEELYNRKKLPANTLEKLKAGYLTAKSQFEAAENALEYTEMKAPFSGYINKKFIEDFETVGAGMPILEILDLSDLEVVFNIPESKVNDINNISKFSCDIKNANISNIPAKFKSMSKKSGEDRMYETKIILEGDSLISDIKPGMIAKVNALKSLANKGAFLVPVESVFTIGNDKFIWVIKDSLVVKQKVAVIRIEGNGLMQIKSTVKAGDMVVTAGVNSLSENQKVKILPKQSETNIGGLL